MWVLGNAEDLALLAVFDRNASKTEEAALGKHLQSLVLRVGEADLAPTSLTLLLTEHALSCKLFGSPPSRRNKFCGYTQAPLTLRTHSGRLFFHHLPHGRPLVRAVEAIGSALYGLVHHARHPLYRLS